MVTEMIKFGLIVATIIATSQAQRAPYAGSPDRPRPPVHPQYLITNSNSVDPMVTIGERFGEDAAPRGSPTYRVPYDPYNDPTLMNRLKKLPVDKQPYWYINRVAIDNHVGRNSDRTTGTAYKH